MIGIDLDRKDGVDGVAGLNELAYRYGFEVPRTLTVCTPSGGFHLWFTAPTGVLIPNSASKLAPGIDVRGTAGYLVGPGVTYAHGSYFVHPELAAVPEAYPIPEVLLDLILPPPAPPVRRRSLPSPTRAGARMVGLTRTVLEAQPGQRNARLFWAACKASEAADSHQVDVGHLEDALTEAAIA
ncbi:bifunctional DNA primase/polymerase, partial [Streptomyces sp. N35]|uniref:bifunctional DNA primase/polymerase n=1 Tax=Streptomyces sp. N35 TaxID=2795730 RepID=UPI001F1AA530